MCTGSAFKEKSGDAAVCVVPVVFNSTDHGDQSVYGKMELNLLFGDFSKWGVSWGSCSGCNPHVTIECFRVKYAWHDKIVFSTGRNTFVSWAMVIGGGLVLCIASIAALWACGAIVSS